MAPVTVRPQDARRGRRFAAALESGGSDLAYLPLTRLAGAMGPALPVSAPTDDFRLALRNRLLAVGTVGVTPAPAIPAATPWRRRLVAASAVLAITTGGAAATAVASTDALPGDRLYQVKRAVEQIQLALAGSELDKAKRYLAIASERLSEVRTLLALNPAAAEDPALVQELRDTLSAASGALAEGAERFFAIFGETADASVLAPLERFLAERTALLSELRGVLPVELLPKQASLVVELETIAARVATVTGRALSAGLTPAVASETLAERPTAAARASRSNADARSEITDLGVDRTMHNIDKQLEEARVKAEQDAAAAAAEREKQHAQMQKDFSKLVEVDLMGDKGRASVGAVEGLDGIGAQPDRSVAAEPGRGTPASSSSAASSMLLSLLPLPEYSLNAPLPGSLTASLDFDNGRMGGKHARITADR